MRDPEQWRKTPKTPPSITITAPFFLHLKGYNQKNSLTLFRLKSYNKIKGIKTSDNEIYLIASTKKPEKPIILASYRSEKEGAVIYFRMTIMPQNGI